MPLSEATVHPGPGPSASAWMTATLRAAHQVFDTPLILGDPNATRIIGARHAEQLLADAERLRHPLSLAMRTTMVVRARLAQDMLEQAGRRAVRQHVILGAGLDTYAWRTDHVAGTRVWEVDLPAMQQWKQACLTAAGMAVPAALTFVAADFNADAVIAALERHGFDSNAPASFSWLGVSMYLAPEHVMRLLHDVANCAPGSSIVFDYRVPDQALTPSEQQGLQVVASMLAAQGEALVSSFMPQQLEHMLRQLGFGKVEHFGPQELTQRYLQGRSDRLQLSGIFRMIAASV